MKLQIVCPHRISYFAFRNKCRKKISLRELRLPRAISFCPVQKRRVTKSSHVGNSFAKCQLLFVLCSTSGFQRASSQFCLFLLFCLATHWAMSAESCLSVSRYSNNFKINRFPIKLVWTVNYLALISKDEQFIFTASDLSRTDVIDFSTPFSYKNNNTNFFY